MPIPVLTLCWDCANAVGGCTWSDDFKPVEGWTAKLVHKSTFYGESESYVVEDCPCFIRDAYANGTKRYRKEDELCDLGCQPGKQ